MCVCDISGESHLQMRQCKVSLCSFEALAVAAQFWRQKAQPVTRQVMQPGLVCIFKFSGSLGTTPFSVGHCSTVVCVIKLPRQAHGCGPQLASINNCRSETCSLLAPIVCDAADTHLPFSLFFAREKITMLQKQPKT